MPIEYRDRPEGSESKLNTVSDGIKVVAMIGTLFKDYRPLKFFSLVALLFAVIGLALGMPIVVEYFQTGLVPRFPTAMLAASFMFLCGLSLATGFILDSVAKVEKSSGRSTCTANTPTTTSPATLLPSQARGKPPCRSSPSSYRVTTSRNHFRSFSKSSMASFAS